MAFDYVTLAANFPAQEPAPLGDSYILFYIIETGEECERELIAETEHLAIVMATDCLMGGEGLISCISLTDSDGEEITFEPFF